MNTLRIGSIELTVVSDGQLRLDPAGMFGPQQPAEWRAQVHLDNGRIPLSVNCVLIRVGERHILLDTGTGRDVPELMARFGGGTGLLVDNLAMLGVRPQDIDTVIVSHAHADHVGGATQMVDPDAAVPTFSEALYWMWEQEWTHWTQPEMMAERPFLQLKLPPLLAHGQLELADEEVEVAPGVRLLAAPGHTPGHVCVAIVSGREMAIYTGDLVHHAAQFDHPEWSPLFDWLPEMSAASRQHILDLAARERATLITAHLPTPGIALPPSAAH